MEKKTSGALPWTPQEIALLRTRSRAGFSVKSTAILLNRSLDSVKGKMNYEKITIGWKSARGTGVLPTIRLRMQRASWNWAQSQAQLLGLPTGIFLRQLLEETIREKSTTQPEAR